MTETGTASGTNTSSNVNWTSTGITSGNNTVTVDLKVDYKALYEELLTKYNGVLSELDNLGYTLLTYSRSLKKEAQK